MKKILSAAVVTAAFATSFSAHAAGAYVSVDAGQANWSGDLSQGWDSKTPSSYQIAVGYNFTPTWGIEIGYADLGKLNGTFSDTVGGVPFTFTGEVKTKDYYLAATGNFPINDKFSFFGKLGIANNKTQSSATVAGTTLDFGTTNTTTAMIAIGGAYKFTQNLSGTFAYTAYGSNDDDVGGTTVKGNVGAVTLGLKYNF